MKKIILFLLIISVAVCFATTPKFFLPVLIESSNGRPIQNQNVDLYHAGSTKATDCLWLDGGRYYYTDTTAVTPGLYDIYINTISYMTNVYIGSNTSAALATLWKADIADSTDTLRTTFIPNMISDSLDVIRASMTDNSDIADSLNISRYAVPIWSNFAIADTGVGDTTFNTDNYLWSSSNTTWQTKLDVWYNVNEKLQAINFWYDRQMTGAATGYIRIWLDTGTKIDTALVTTGLSWQYSENYALLLDYDTDDAGTMPTSRYAIRIRIQMKCTTADGYLLVRPYALEAVYATGRSGDF